MFQLGARDFDLLHDLIDELLRSASLSLFREEELSTIVYSLGMLRYADPSVSTLLNKIFEEVSCSQSIDKFEKGAHGQSVASSCCLYQVALDVKILSLFE